MDLKKHLDDYAAYYMASALPLSGTQKSARSYARRLKRAFTIALSCKELADLAGATSEQELLDYMLSLNKSSRTAFIDLIEALVLEEFNNRKKRSLLDVISSIRLYRDKFMPTIPCGKSGNKPELETIHKNHRFYSHDVLLKAFKNRLGTWGRYYAPPTECYLPFRMLRMLFSDIPDYKILVYEILEGVKFLTGKKTLTLSEVKYLYIDPTNHVFAFAHGRRYQILSRGKTIHPMVEKGIDQITIDHETALANCAEPIVSGCYPEILRLSEDILQAVKNKTPDLNNEAQVTSQYKYGAPHSKGKHLPLLHHYWDKPYDRIPLFKEYERILKSTSYEAMGASDNSSKGKRRIAAPKKTNTP